MQVNLCRHIKTNGLQCRGVQLTGSEFCYFHRRLHRSHEPYRNQVYFHPARIDRTTSIQLPAVEDRESAQLAISCVINALASGYIDRKQANSLFYGLQLATTNARGLRIIRRPAQQVRDVEKESASPIPETNPDLAPPGRTREIEDDPNEISEVKLEPLPDRVPKDRVPQVRRSPTSSTLGIKPPWSAQPLTQQPENDNEEPSMDDDGESPTNSTLFLTPVVSRR